MPTSRKVLCAVYATISVAALIATWSQNVAYFNSVTGLGAFVSETRVTPASRSITVDILFFFLAAAILMVIEARKHGVKFVWAYIVGGGLIAISVTFPLFLIARELRLRTSDAPELRTIDTALLAIVSVLTVGLAIWVDVGQ
jgi:hypothetical protein